MSFSTENNQASNFTAVQEIIANYDNFTENNSDIYTAQEVNHNKTYDHHFQVGEQNNLRVTRFIDAADQEYNLFTTIDTVNIQRVDNEFVQGERQIIWFEQESRTETEINVKPTVFNTMEEGLSGDIINRGVDNLFVNSGNSEGNNNNIERVDFISTQGLSVPQNYLDDIGFLMMERGGNDPFKIAAITGIDEAGKPTEFSSNLLEVGADDWNSSSYNVSAEVMRQEPEDTNPRSTTDLDSQAIAGLFISYADLGITGDQTFYGFAIFPTDIDSSHDLIGLSDFPTNTPEKINGTSIGGLDLIASGSIFVRGNLPPEITSNGGGETATIEITENSTVVTDVDSIDDRDSEGNGLTYSITGGDDGGEFTIDSQTGQLDFLKTPDFENPTDSDGDNNYYVEVTVTDSQGSTDVQQLTVTVGDQVEAEVTPPPVEEEQPPFDNNPPVEEEEEVEENNPPEITSDGGENTATVEITENNTVITDVDSIDDRDSEGNGLTYTITGGDDGGEFTIDSQTGQLDFLKTPDFENPTDSDGDNNYYVEVTVTDSQGSTDVQQLTVTVGDQVEAEVTPPPVVTNNPPEITSDGGGETATVEITENNTVVTDVDSIDEHDSEGNGLTYSITGGDDGGQFNIDSQTGELDFLKTPDFENPTDSDGDNNYYVEVTVTDTQGSTDVQQLTVTVGDQVEAEVTPPPVEEEQPPFDNNPPVEEEEEVTNNSPEITSNGGGETATLEIIENNTVITDVDSIDDHDSEGNGLTYSITGGDDGGQFNIDSQTGELDFLKTPDFENPTDSDGDNNYYVEVTVTDSQGSTDVQQLTVTVGDQVEAEVTPPPVEEEQPPFDNNPPVEEEEEVTNNSPEITSNGGGETATVEIIENNTVITDVDSIDDHESEGNGLTYSITGGDDGGEFTIDSQTGELDFLKTPDFENPTDSDGDNNYYVEVTVTDTQGSTDVQQLTITVGDQDENYPEPIVEPQLETVEPVLEPTVAVESVVEIEPETVIEPAVDDDNTVTRTQEEPNAEETFRQPRNNNEPSPSTPVEQTPQEGCCCPPIPDFEAIALPNRPQMTTESPMDRVLEGTETEDVLIGNSLNEALISFGGNDILNGLDKDDWMEGGSGNDHLRGDMENDTLIGEAGNDTLLGGRDDRSGIRDVMGQDWVLGGQGDDFLSGNESRDMLMGDVGHDMAYGGKGDDQIFGDSGNDTLHGDDGNDTIIGTNGDDHSAEAGEEEDVIYGYRHNDVIQGGPGRDMVFNGKENDFSYGGKDDDLMWGDLGFDTVYGDRGNDTLFGDTNDPNQTTSEGQDLMWGGAGDDFMDGNRNNDTLSGGEGNDIVRGGKGNDLVFGDVGDDELYGDLGNDTLCGNEGDDTMFGDTENENAPGGQDKLCGGSGNDVVMGNRGQDTLCGSDGEDTLFGGKEDDLLKGKTGDDWLFGDLGNDTLIGGEGRDRFVLSNSAGVDLIEDFQLGQDLILLGNGLTFSDLEIIQQDTAVAIAVANQPNLPFAILNGISADLLTQAHFVTESLF